MVSHAAAVRWARVDLVFEAARKRRTAYQSGRREVIGLRTRRDMLGFEEPGKRKVIPKRKRPKRVLSMIARTPLRAKTTKSRVW